MERGAQAWALTEFVLPQLTEPDNEEDGRDGSEHQRRSGHHLCSTGRRCKTCMEDNPTTWSGYPRRLQQAQNPKGLLVFLAWQIPREAAETCEGLRDKVLVPRPARDGEDRAGLSWHLNAQRLQVQVR